MTAKKNTEDVLEDTTWVGVKEAAERTGASPSIIRKWMEKDLPTRQGTGPRGLRTEVPLDVVQERATRLPGARPAALPADAGAPGTALVPFAQYEQLVARLADAERARGRLEGVADGVAEERDRLRVMHLDLVREVEQLRAQLAATGRPDGEHTSTTRKGLFRRG